jgi:hypothetical protein
MSSTECRRTDRFHATFPANDRHRHWIVFGWELSVPLPSDFGGNSRSGFCDSSGDVRAVARASLLPLAAAPEFCPGSTADPIAGSIAGAGQTECNAQDSGSCAAARVFLSAIARHERAGTQLI